MNLYPKNGAVDGSTRNSAIIRPVTLGTAVTNPASIATRDISYFVACIREGRVEPRFLRRLLQVPARKVSSTGALRRLLKEQRRMRLRSTPVHPDTFIIDENNEKGGFSP